MLGATTVTNIGTTILSGNLDVSPGTAITGLGSITLGGILHEADSPALLAQSNTLSAYNSLNALAFTTDLTGVNLGNQVLTPDVYEFNASAQLTGLLTLNAQNQSNATYVFEIGSTLTTASNSGINVINDVNDINIFWLVCSSATLKSNTNFTGSILAN